MKSRSHATAVAVGIIIVVGMMAPLPSSAQTDRDRPRLHVVEPGSQKPLQGAVWDLKCFTGDGDGTTYVDTTFVGRVQSEGGAIVWQVRHETKVRYLPKRREYTELGRKNIVTGDCSATARPDSPRLELMRSKRTSSIDRRMMAKEEQSLDPRKTVPSKVLPDSLYRKDMDEEELETMLKMIGPRDGER